LVGDGRVTRQIHHGHFDRCDFDGGDVRLFADELQRQFVIPAEARELLRFQSHACRARRVLWRRWQRRRAYIDHETALDELARRGDDVLKHQSP
jgi:hypothetical protein